MASGAYKALATFLLFINLIMYIIVCIIAGWAVNFGIDMAYEKAYGTYPGKLFPIYFPIGNMATGFFVFFALIAGVYGIGSSLVGLNSIQQWNVSSLTSAASCAIVSWSLTLLAMGLACKEIDLKEEVNARLRTLEVFIIILSGTQLICAAAISSEAMAIERRPY